MAGHDFSPQQPGPKPESGLEVVSSEHSGGLGPQLNSKNAPENYLYSLSPDAYDQSMYSPTPTANQNEQENTGVSRQTPPKKRKRNLVIIAIVLAVVVVAAVVGGVLGSRAANSNNEDTDGASSKSSSPASDAAMTGTPTSVYPGLSPTALSWGHPHLEVFALTRNNTDPVYRVWRNSNATGDDDFLPRGTDMELVGGQTTDARYMPSVAIGHFSPGPSGKESRNQTVLHMKTDDYRAYRQFHNDAQVWNKKNDVFSWNGFKGLEFLSPPTVVSYEQPRRMIKTFAVGKKHNGNPGIYHFDWNGQWQDPKLAHSGEPVVQNWAPTVVAWSGDDSRHDLFAVSQTNSHVFHWSKGSGENEGWSGPEDLGGFATTQPTVVSLAPGRLDVFVRGGDGGLWHRGRNGTSAADAEAAGTRWSDWQRLGGPATIRGRPHAFSAGGGRADVFAWGTNGALLRLRWDDISQSWRSGGREDNDDSGGGFEVLVETGLMGPPSATTDGGRSICVFAYNTENQIIWQRIGPDGEMIGSFQVLADVPYSVDSLPFM